MKRGERGLGFWSEQGFETVHSNFKTEWDNVKVDLAHPEYLSKLSKTVARYNSRHI